MRLASRSIVPMVRKSAKAPVAMLAVLLALCGCQGIGLSNMDTGGYATPSGISNMDLQSPDKPDDDWLKGYYGGSHGWGWSTDRKDSPNCDFYSTCKGSQQDPTGQGDDKGGGLGW